MTHIRLVKIEVPRPHTSFSRRVPAYEVPLWKRKWEGYIEPGYEVTVSDVPAILGNLAFRDIADAEFERQRLMGEFRRHHVTGDPIFDAVYPADSFLAEYDKVIAKYGITLEYDEEGHVTGAVTVEPVAIDDLSKIAKVGKKLIAQFVEAGFVTYEQIAEAELDELIKKVEGVGIGNVETIQESAKDLAAATLAV